MDTLGWILFKGNDLAAAEKYLIAAWQLGQHAVSADHLGRLYDKQGKHTEAIHMWRLALALDAKEADAQEQLRKAGAAVAITPKIGDRGAATPAPSQELGELRSIKLPALSKQRSGSELFLLISRTGIDDVQFIGTNAHPTDAERVIRATKYSFPFPDESSPKIARRAILFCSEVTTPSCNLTMMLPATTKLVPMLGLSPADTKALDAPTTAPTLLAKVEPQYSKAARDSKVEGTVTLSVVVDETGSPHNVSVVRPLGLGLDEEATSSVLKWRFNPATRNGKPVRAQAQVEINFHLYNDPQ